MAELVHLGQRLEIDRRHKDVGHPSLCRPIKNLLAVVIKLFGIEMAVRINHNKKSF